MDLFESLGSFLPFLIFVLIAIAKASDRKKKKGGASAPLPNGSPSGRAGRRSGGGSIFDLKETLKRAIEEMGLDREILPDVDSAASVLSVDQPVAAQPSEGGTLESALGDPLIGDEVRSKVCTHTPRTTPSAEIAIREPQRSPSLSRDSLRDAVIWSEILNAPVALRE